MKWMDDLFELQAIIALVLVVGYIAMCFVKISPTETYISLMWVVIGFVFGTNNKPKNGGAV